MSTPVPSGSPAGLPEDLSVRMARMETDLSWVKREMATRADVAAVRGEIAGLRGELKTDIAQLRVELKTDIGALETRLIKWMIATALTCAGVAAAAASAATRLAGLS